MQLINICLFGDSDTKILQLFKSPKSSPPRCAAFRPSVCSDAACCLFRYVTAPISATVHRHLQKDYPLTLQCGVQLYAPIITENVCKEAVPVYLKNLKALCMLHAYYWNTIIYLSFWGSPLQSKYAQALHSFAVSPQAPIAAVYLREARQDSA